MKTKKINLDRLYQYFELASICALGLTIVVLQLRSIIP